MKKYNGFVYKTSRIMVIFLFLQILPLNLIGSLKTNALDVEGPEPITGYEYVIPTISSNTIMPEETPTVLVETDEYLYSQDDRINSNETDDSEVLSVSDNDNLVYPTPVTAPYLYSYDNHESVSMNTGTLVYENTDYLLPGINGLDLVISHRYDSSKANVNVPRYSITPHLLTTLTPNYSQTSLFRLGYGWGFAFSYIGNDSTSGNSVLHLADGREFVIDEWVQNTAKFKDYDCSDIVLEKHNYEYQSEEGGSYYRLTYSDGKKEYFLWTGDLLAIQDRFGNTIRFDFNRFDSTYLTITDSLGRVIVFAYTETDYGHLVTAYLPNNQRLYYEVEHNLYDDTIQYLRAFTDINGQRTQYSYTQSIAKVDLFHNPPHVILSANNTWMNLTTITHPTNAKTKYTYQKTLRELGDQGCMEAYRILSREDSVSNVSYNHLDYTYTGDYTLCPDPEDEPNSTYQYSATITDNSGVSTTILFDFKHFLISKTTSYSGVARQIVNYTYDEAKRRPTVITTQTLNEQGASVTASLRYTYDQYGNVTAEWSTLAEGSASDTEHKTTYTYGSTYNLLLTKIYKTDVDTTVTVTNTLSSDYKKITKTTVSVNGTITQRVDYTYDTYGNILSARQYTNLPATNKYVDRQYTYQNGAYLSKEAVINVVDSYGESALSTPGEANGTISKAYTYNTIGKVISATDENGNTTTYTYDNAGNITQIAYPDASIVSYSRDFTNNRLTATDENGNALIYTYTPLGLEYEIVDAATNLVITHNTYDTKARLSRQDNYLYGAATVYTYDAFDRKLSETVYQGNTILAQTLYTYDDAAENGQYFKVTKTVVGTSTSPSIITTEYTDKHGNTVKTGRVVNGIEYFDTYTYDYVGNRLTALTAADYARNLAFTAQYTYNENGKVLRTYNAESNYTENVYDSVGNLVTAKDYAGTPTTFTYDALGRLLTEKVNYTNQYYGITRHAYDAVGNEVTRLEPVNTIGLTESLAKTEYTYDSRNRLTSVIQYDHGNVKSVSRYTYDGVGNILTSTTGAATVNGAGKTISYTYDRFGNVLTMTDALNAQENYSYSSLGKLLSKTDRNGVTTSYAYDALGRTVSITAGSGSSQEVVNYTYTKTGLTAETENRWQYTAYTYDALGRPITITEQERSILSGSALTGYVKSYVYDQADNPVSFTLTSGSQTIQSLGYSYDDLHRLISVQENGVTQAAYTYNVNGARTSLSYANGASETYAYNLAGWVTNVTNSAGGNTVSSYNYTYLSSGCVKTMTDHNNVTTTYTYDHLKRLTKEVVSGGPTTQYTYDASGNRTKVKVTLQSPWTANYTYDANNRLILESSNKGGAHTTAYLYDANGNMTSATTGSSTTTYTYNTLNQLTYVTAAVPLASYAYNANGIRTAKVTQQGYDRYLLNGGNVAAETDENGNITNYIRGINLICRDDGTDRNYYLFNAHGDVVNLVDGVTAAVTRAYAYDAFGNEKNPVSTDKNPFRYCGEYRDSETDTYYLRARYYDPALGRFTQEDTHWNSSNMLYGDKTHKKGEYKDYLSLAFTIITPEIAAIRQSGNLYVYCMDNPVLYVDNTGKSVILACILIGAVIGGMIGGVTAAEISKSQLGFVNGKWVLAGVVAGALLGGLVGWEVGVVASAVGTSLTAGSGGILGTVVYQTWQQAEESLRTSLGAVSKSFTTPLGERIVDAYNDVKQVIAEAKYGYTSLTQFVIKEIEKDLWLLENNPEIQSIEWHFFQSAATGNGGPSGPLLEKLLENGIIVIFH